MDPSRARFSVRRQDTHGGEWRPLTTCDSKEYAEMIAAIGLQKRIGAAYTATDQQTGEEIALLPQGNSKAA
jgi:hypothetical protein